MKNGEYNRFWKEYLLLKYLSIPRVSIEKMYHCSHLFLYNGQYMYVAPRGNPAGTYENPKGSGHTEQFQQIPLVSGNPRYMYITI